MQLKFRQQLRTGGENGEIFLHTHENLQLYITSHRQVKFTGFKFHQRADSKKIKYSPGENFRG